MGNAKVSQKTADFQRKPQKTAGTRRRPQIICVCPLRFVPQARPSFVNIRIRFYTGLHKDIDFSRAPQGRKHTFGPRSGSGPNCPLEGSPPLQLEDSSLKPQPFSPRPLPPSHPHPLALFATLRRGWPRPVWGRGPRARGWRCRGFEYSDGRFPQTQFVITNAKIHPSLGRALCGGSLQSVGTSFWEFISENSPEQIGIRSSALGCDPDGLLENRFRAFGPK